MRQSDIGDSPDGQRWNAELSAAAIAITDAWRPGHASASGMTKGFGLFTRPRVRCRLPGYESYWGLLDGYQLSPSKQRAPRTWQPHGDELATHQHLKLFQLRVLARRQRRGGADFAPFGLQLIDALLRGLAIKLRDRVDELRPPEGFVAGQRM